MLPCLIIAAALASAPTGGPVPSGPVAAPEIKPGDVWVFDRTIEKDTNGFNDQRLVFKVERVGTDTMVVGVKPEGSPLEFQDHVMGVDWSQRRIVEGAQTMTGRPLAFPMAVGKTWSNDYTDPTRHGLQTSADHHETFKVTGWEDVTTPAGTFHALKIESDDKIKAQFMAATGAVGGTVTTANGATVVAQSQHSGPQTKYGEAFSTAYYAPQIKYWVKMVREDYNSENVRFRRQTDTLVSFTPAP